MNFAVKDNNSGQGALRELGLNYIQAIPCTATIPLGALMTDGSLVNDLDGNPVFIAPYSAIIGVYTTSGDLDITSISATSIDLFSCDVSDPSTQVPASNWIGITPNSAVPFVYDYQTPFSQIADHGPNLSVFPSSTYDGSVPLVLQMVLMVINFPI